MKKKGIGNAYKPNDGQDDDFLFARQLIVTAKGRQVAAQSLMTLTPRRGKQKANDTALASITETLEQEPCG
ncbi:uncharacterized protein LMH87_009216 [Akanthomyces muscarius]|uniref:Uncharacterized protein n=1 Tax=Akanthomyces muscarius TaxID=2231603 RepID=A0A9W8QHU4_AKAMU|nr:uncharacterized protein LMH87_009216 [Akanthomyces muscarius]KAJ4158701.1 hypothetical protein LMH87_009216 [Akanthomyces muscarius]